MPSLNLRLSREEHDALVARAAASGRSLQRQIVWMLNRGLEEDGLVEGRRGVRPDQERSAVPDTSAATGLGVNVPVAAPPSRQVRTSSAGCPGFVPAGVRCKLCGQVHQPKGRKS